MTVSLLPADIHLVSTMITFLPTYEGSPVPCSTVCNTASQTPALQAGDLASPSPFLW